MKQWKDQMKINYVWILIDTKNIINTRDFSIFF